MISLFAQKNNEQATLALYETLQDIDFPEDVGIAINNIEGGKSGILRKNGKVVDISLANCYTLEDVVRELIGLIAREEKAE